MLAIKMLKKSPGCVIDTFFKGMLCLLLCDLFYIFFLYFWTHYFGFHTSQSMLKAQFFSSVYMYIDKLFM